ncbi:MAG: DEAD/DEAH box helicase family protein [Oligoflexia bacterium]|nr:DEAD/DEAH box helicase family protein [Oligoflexia bacterium]
MVAAKLIAELKINTLILVHRQQLLSQWKNRLSVFLRISSSKVTGENGANNESALELPSLAIATLPTKKKRGRKKIKDCKTSEVNSQLNDQNLIIGQIGAGKNCLSSVIDVAIMQSINSKGEIKEFVKNYGLVIVDECHHVPAFSFASLISSLSPLLSPLALALPSPL